VFSIDLVARELDCTGDRICRRGNTRRERREVAFTVPPGGFGLTCGERNSATFILLDGWPSLFSRNADMSSSWSASLGRFTESGGPDISPIGAKVCVTDAIRLPTLDLPVFRPSDFWRSESKWEPPPAEWRKSGWRSFVNDMLWSRTFQAAADWVDSLASKLQALETCHCPPRRVIIPPAFKPCAIARRVFFVTELDFPRFRGHPLTDVDRSSDGLPGLKPSSSDKTIFGSRGSERPPAQGRDPPQVARPPSLPKCVVQAADARRRFHLPTSQELRRCAGLSGGFELRKACLRYCPKVWELSTILTI